MEPRHVGGRLAEVDGVFMWMQLDEESGEFVEIAKALAREWINIAKESGLKKVYAFVKGNDLYLGADESAFDAEAVAGEADEEEEEDAGEEEEEEDLGEEEEEEADEEEEEETPPAKVAETKKKARK